MPKKPVMVLDPNLPKTKQFPLDPETGKPWKERERQIALARTGLELSRTKRDRKLWKDLVALLSEGVTFQEVPYVSEPTLSIGPDPLDHRLFFCHPDTWEKMSSAEKARFKMEWVE